MGDFEQFFGFFSKLVSPIELILFSLAWCPSRTSFDRSHGTSATILKFDPHEFLDFKNYGQLKITPKSKTSNVFSNNGPKGTNRQVVEVWITLLSTSPAAAS